jgi:ankyrin repeat protein
MKAFILSIFIVIVPLFSMCIFPDSHRNVNEENIAEQLSYQESIAIAHNYIDFSKIEISKDSLDLKLYYLLESAGDMSKDLLINNIDNLVERGANPNAMLEITYSVRKMGTYIPIIKHFYRDKYNEYTTITTPMHAAVGSKNVLAVEKLIALGGKIDLINQDNVLPMDIALKNDQEEMVNCLLKHGCKVSDINLALSENTALIERLVKLGANPKSIDINYALNNKAELKRLLALKPEINELNLDMSVLMKDDELFDLLLDNGMSPKVMGRFPDECPIIFSAVKYGNMRDLKKLIAKGASIHETCSNGFGETPLQVAIHYKQVEIMVYLLDLKAIPNEKDWTGKSALMQACGTDNDQIINILIDRGADIEYSGYFGGTPLIQAVKYKNYIAAETLIKRKANVNFKTKFDDTPLSLAVEANDYAMVKMLVENGANPKVTIKGKNLVQYAQEKEVSPAIVNYLKGLIEK